MKPIPTMKQSALGLKWLQAALHLSLRTKTLWRNAILFLIVVIATAGNLQAVDYFYQSGDPAVLANWNTLLGGGGATPPNFTTMTDRFFIPNGRTAVLLSNLTFGSNVLLQVQTGGGLNAQGFSFLGAGDFELQNGSFLITAHANGVNGGTVQNTGARTYGATVSYTFNAVALTQSTGFLPGMPIGAAQAITVNNQNVGTPGTLVFDNSMTLTGALTIVRGTVDCGAGLNHTFNGGANSVVVSTGTVFIRRNGNITAPAGTFQYVAGTPIPQLRYDAGMGMLVTSSSELPSTMPGEVRIENNMTLQLGASISANAPFTANGSLNLGTFSLTNNSSFSVGATSVVDMNAGTMTWNGAVSFTTGHLFQDNSAGGNATLNLAGSGAITGSLQWLGGLNNLGTLTINRIGATLTAVGTLTIANALSLQQGFIAATEVSVTSPMITAIQGGSSASYVLGRLRRRVPPNQTGSPNFLFPVGTGGTYMPISFTDAVTGPGAPSVIIEAFTGLTTGVLGANVSSLSSIYWQVQPGVAGDYTQMALVAMRSTPPLLVTSSAFTGANATNATFSLLNSNVTGLILQTTRFPVSAVGPSFFAIGNATPIPVITSFSPVTGGNATIATITGMNFTNASQVTFGGTPAQSFQVLSPTVIRATVNNGSTGPISVVTLGGTGFSSTTFAYAPPPQITGVTPTAGGNTTIVSLRGRNLASTGTVTFGGRLMTIVLRTDTLVQVRCSTVDVSGAIALGTLGGATTTTSTFSYLFPPSITAFSPPVATRLNVLTITGANLSIVNSVTVGGAPVLSVTVNSSTQISIALLEGSTGTIVVRTPAGEAISQRTFFYAEPPRLSGVFFNGLPTNTAVAGSTLLVRGQNFLFATTANIGNVTAAIVAILSSTEMTIRLPLDAVTTASLRVATPGGLATTTAQFTVLPGQAITDVSPINGTTGTLVSITGRNFPRDVAVNIAGTSASSVIVVSTTQILAVVGALPPRTTRGAITVSSTLGTFSTTTQFIVSNVTPVIAAISPLTATFGSIVQVRGQFLTGVREVSIGGARAEIVESVSPTELLVRVTRQNTSGTMTLTTLGGSTTSTLRMTIIPSPFIVSFSPPFAVSGATITLRGGNFTGTTSVIFGTMPATQFNVLSDSVMTATLGTGSTGLIRIAGARGTAVSPTELRVVSQLDFETEVLRVLYDSLGGASWNNRATNRWLSGDPPSEWTGVTVQNGRITQIRLPDNGLRGRLPDILGELTALRVLDLTDNNITGTFPAWIPRATTLEEVRIGGNQFTGTLPDSLGVMPNLRVFVADRNRLSGALPQTLCSLQVIRDLNLNQNAFTGEIPPCFGQLRTLQALDLGQNMLAGTIPTELGDLTDLQSLYLHRNRLSGTIPASLGSATAATLTAMTSEKGSSSLTAANNLRRLWLGGNQLTGEVPESMRSLTALEELLLDNNQLFGESVMRIVPSLTNLQTLDIGRNRFSGTLPNTLGNLRRLRFLALRNNTFSGVVPTTLGNLDTLQSLFLDSNAFTGTVPAQFGALRNLQTLGLSFNQFTTLPRMSALLSVLSVQGNRLQFGDLQTNAAVPDFTYIPQDSIGAVRDTGVVIGNPMLLTVNVSGRDNLYQWFKNGVEVQTTSATVGFRVEQFAVQDTGVYTCAVTNRLIERLTLVSRPIRVRALEPRPPNQAPELVFPQSGATFVAFSPTMQWTRVDNAIRYEVQVSQLSDFTLLTTTANVRSADTTLTTINTRIDGLEPLTLYYWRVRALNGVDVASAWSQVNSFITAPSGVDVSISSINFGNVILGETATGTAFLTNLTNQNLVIVDIDGNDNEFSFRIPLDVRSLRLNAGQTVSIRGISFAPRSPGIKTASARITYIKSNGDTAAVRLDNVLLGRGTPIRIDSVNFDTIRVGRTAQTLAQLSNRGGVTTRVIIDSVAIVGSTNGFAAERLTEPLYINSGAASSVIVRCAPTTTGNVSANLRYWARFIQPNANGTSVIFRDTLTTRVSAVVRDTLITDFVYAVGVRPARGQERLPPGSAVRMEVYIARGDMGNLIQFRPLSYSTIIRFNRQVLAFGTNPLPLRAIFNPEANNNIQRISVTVGTVSQSALGQLTRDSVLFRFTCTAVAGETTQTPIELEYFRLSVDTVRATAFPQAFTAGERVVFVEGLERSSFTAAASRAGGTRLIARAPTTTATLSAVAPNPVLDAGQVKFTIAEASPVQLVLVDIFGNVLKVLAEYPMASGEYTASVPMQDVPTGTYFVMLRTPQAILTERVQVRR
ncbi:MAG: IPT/TIG domain-containing protein [Candidatus Kapabacteria bacterium]|jgi:Leucine-rich repeat (LRR) protein|nr:IPT/TIG domain-containing protein [Candidatus Kapabacteria bacterium]